YMAGGILGLWLFIWLYRRILASAIWRKIWQRLFRKKHESIVEFYERMQRILSEKGFSRESYQTPAEFAHDLGYPEAMAITDKYNRVRFGGKQLSANEADEIEGLLEKLRT
ncbi:MAG: DUF4129 domain-containing protein, partial [Pyrinomonadaceae bacterium]